MREVGEESHDCYHKIKQTNKELKLLKKFIMRNPQAPSPPNDIEQGKKKELDQSSDIYEVGQTIALPLALSPQTFCFCNSVR